MPPIPSGTPWWAYLLTVVALAAIAAAPALLGLRPIKRAQRDLGRKQEAIHEQVANSHSTNLRDDIDQIHHALEQVVSAQATVIEQQRETRRDIGGIRDEMRTERQERLDLARRVDDQGRQLSQLDRRKD